MKKNAWTMAEMVISITVILILTGLVVNIYKPDVQKAKFYMYATVRNIMKGNISIMDKNFSLNQEDKIGNNDWYCAQLSDAFNLESSPNCLRAASADTVNIQFPNGVALYGVASEWKFPYEGAKFQYKNIMIDINGADGPNKVWGDRFPMRIIGGQGNKSQGVEGLIMPVNCKNDRVYNPFTNQLIAVAAAAKNTYCGTSSKDYTLDDQVLAYDIYRNEDKSEETTAKLIAGMQSPLAADCMAYGGNTGFYSNAECEAAKIRIKKECARKDACSGCTSNTCPEGSTNSETCVVVRDANNPENIGCATILHKPTGGMSFIFQAIIGDIDEI